MHSSHIRPVVALAWRPVAGYGIRYRLVVRGAPFNRAGCTWRASSVRLTGYAITRVGLVVRSMPLPGRPRQTSSDRAQPRPAWPATCCRR